MSERLGVLFRVALTASMLGGCSTMTAFTQPSPATQRGAAAKPAEPPPVLVGGIVDLGPRSAARPVPADAQALAASAFPPAPAPNTVVASTVFPEVPVAALAASAPAPAELRPAAIATAQRRAPAPAAPVAATVAQPPAPPQPQWQQAWTRVAPPVAPQRTSAAAFDRHYEARLKEYAAAQPAAAPVRAPEPARSPDPVRGRPADGVQSHYQRRLAESAWATAPAAGESQVAEAGAPTILDRIVERLANFL